MATTYDINALTEELELDQEDIVELLNDFREFLEGVKPDLEKVVSAGDASAVRSLAHSIKGSAGNLRVGEVYRVAKDLQDAADGKDVEKLKSIHSELSKHIEDFLVESANLS
ncbi:MAG: Hpt domain-containing protein [Planctomycetes bacterium]|nr:Hpt domain-containing protein [Planctomycetota bacterium]